MQFGWDNITAKVEEYYRFVLRRVASHGPLPPHVNPALAARRRASHCIRDERAVTPVRSQRPVQAAERESASLRQRTDRGIDRPVAAPAAHGVNGGGAQSERRQGEDADGHPDRARRDTGSSMLTANWKPQFQVGSRPRWICDSGVGTGRLAMFG